MVMFAIRVTSIRKISEIGIPSQFLVVNFKGLSECRQKVSIEKATFYARLRSKQFLFLVQHIHYKKKPRNGLFEYDFSHSCTSYSLISTRYVKFELKLTQMRNMHDCVQPRTKINVHMF